MTINSLNIITIGLERERQGNAVSFSIPAPTGGLNTRDAEDGMDIRDAIVMTNAIPNIGKVATRNGYATFSSSHSTDVETILEYYRGSIRKMITASGSNVYDTSTGTPSLLSGGFTKGRWNGLMFRGTLVMINGFDAPQGFDGTTLSALTISGSGLNPSLLKGVVAYKNRLWWWDGVSQEIWYGAVDTIGGALTKFDLGSVTNLGGNVIAIANWTIDGGDGVNNRIIFFTNGGQALLYDGADPAVDFALVGVYDMSPPIAQESVVQLSQDVAYINQYDFTTFSKDYGLGTARTGSSKLTGAISEAVEKYRNNAGWQSIFYEKKNWLIFNVPKSPLSSYEQYAMNLTTKGAFKITGWDANVFGIYNRDLYFAKGDKIYRADTGFRDGDDSIDFEIQQAYTNFNIPAPKTPNYIQPFFRTDSTFEVESKILYDFESYISQQVINIESVGTPWGSPWGSPWSALKKIKDKTYPTSGFGTNISLGFASNLNGAILEWYSTNYSLTVNDI